MSILVHVQGKKKIKLRWTGVKKDKNLVHVVVECHLVEGGHEAGNEEWENGNGNGQPGDDFNVEQWILAEG